MTSTDTSMLHRWVERIHQKDKLAENELHDYFYRRLYALSQAMLRTFPEVIRWARASDILQDVYIKRLLPYLRKNRPNSSQQFFSIVAKHMRWELLDLVEKFRGPNSFEGRHESDPGLRNESDQVAMAYDHVSAQAEKEVTQWLILHEAVEQLPERQRVVVDLLIYHGVSKEEAGELLGVSSRQIRRDWSAACNNLREALEGEFPTC